MIFDYDELKEYVSEDFERFSLMGFDEKQIFPAILAEYEYAADFCLVERICIYVFIILNYIEKNMDYLVIVEELKKIIEESEKDAIKEELNQDYEKFLLDIDTIIEK